MPVLVIAVVFFLLFLLMGVMLSSAMLIEHRATKRAGQSVAGALRR